MPKRIEKYIAKNIRAIEQVIGCEGETATFFSRCVVSFGLRGFGFAPRQFGRYAFAL